MSETDLELGLFGVIHMDTLAKVTRELGDFSADTDAIFVEWPADRPGLRMHLQLCLRAPLFLFGYLFIYLLMQGPLFVLFNHDIRPTEIVAIERLTDDGEVPVHPVDDHPAQKLTRTRPSISLLHWIGLAAVVLAGPPAAVATAAVTLFGGVVSPLVRARGHRYLAVTLFLAGIAGLVALFVAGLFSPWLVLAGYIAFQVAIKFTLDSRNDVMLDRIEETAADEGYDDAVLVTGKAHLRGLVEMTLERGLSVPRVHVPEWRALGTTHTEFHPADLPGFEDSSGEDRGTGHRRLVAGSERNAVPRRVAAALVDVYLVAVLSLVTVLVTAILAVVAFGVDQPVDRGWAAASVALTLVAYYTITEWWYGTTPGKDLFGLVVADADGEPPTGRQALVRTLLRPLDLLGGLLVAVTDRSQRLGDIAAGTVVGRVAPPTDTATPADSTDWRDHRAIDLETVGTVETDRLKAVLFDSLVVVLFGMLAGMYAALTLGELGVSAWSPDNAPGWFYLVPIVPAGVLYHALCEWRYGTTPGKQLFTPLVVATADGDPLSARAAILRNVLRPIDAVGIYLVGWLATEATDRRQRLGDLAAGTIVGRPASPADTDEQAAESTAGDDGDDAPNVDADQPATTA